MKALVGRPVLSIGSEVYRWEDVVLAAHLRGEWKSFADRTAAGEAALRRMRERGEDVPEDELDSASNEFRYERNLLSADDLDAWLAERELDVEDWLGFLRRERIATGLPPGPGRRRIPDGDFSEVLRVDGICSGTLRRLAESLARRAAVHARLDEEQNALPCGPRARAAGARALKPIALAPLGLAADEVRDRAGHLACVEDAYRRFVERDADPSSVAREVDAHRVEWAAVTYRSCRVGDENLARELAMCVREDGQTLEEAAASARVAVVASNGLLADADAAVKDVLLSARAGELIGPVHGEEGFLLVQVLDRREASAEIGMVAERAARSIREREIERELAGRVRWHHRL